MASRKVLAIGAALIGMIALAAAACAVLLSHFSAQAGPAAHPDPIRQIATSVPEPRLQPTPQADLAAYRREKTLALRRYGWLDAEHRYAQVPVERAMALLLETRAQGAAKQPEKSE